MEPHRQSDEELIAQFRNGILTAGANLYLRYKNSMYSFCLRMLRDPEDAKDATQETFLKMIAKIGSIEKGESIKSWLFAVARNEVLMVVRRKKIIPMESYDDEAIVYDHRTPLNITIESEMKEKLGKAIQQLKPAYRETYLLREMDGLSYEEIARVTDSTISAVKSKLYKSRVALNEMLSPYL